MEILKEYNTNWNTTIYDSANIVLGIKIGSGASGTVFRSKLNDKNVICKCLYVKSYNDDLIELFDDIDSELMIYTKLIKTNYCCELIGVSLNENAGTFYMILKDYDVGGDMNDYINKSIFWTKYLTKDYNHSKKDKWIYIYEYENKTWIYHMSRKIKISLLKF